MWKGLLIVAMLAVTASAMAASGNAPVSLGKIVVSGTPLPMPGFGVPLAEVPANVQTFGAADIAAQAGSNLPQLLWRNLGSVHLANGQNNPFQPELSFRGFDVSPLLGTPEALSVYVDGVRVNEPFGDVVNFDLIPLAAISQVTLVPGSDPVYGLNTLGGALSFATKSGFDAAGLAASAYTGSFGTESGTLEYGAHGTHAGYYIAATHYDSDGWAAHNPSRVNQLFAKASFRGGANSLDISFTGADNRLGGNQTLPLAFLADPNGSYTFPDYFYNKLAFVAVNGRHAFSGDLALEGNVYNRVLDNDGFDSDVNDDFEPQKPVNVHNSPSVNDFNNTHEHGYGGTLQLVSSAPAAAMDNHFAAGVSINAGDTYFAQDQQAAVFSPARESVGIDAAAPRTRLDAINRYASFYLTDTLHFAPRFALTASARYNHAHIMLHDRLGTALNGDHSFARINPAIGLTYNPVDDVTTWLAYDEGTRAPTPSELTCADPAAPCSLPNAFLADPPLRQVIARSWEAGARGHAQNGLQWSASIYRTDLDNDLLFISLTGLKGFYMNVPGDRRQGLELGIKDNIGALSLSAHYSFIDATYRSAFTESSPSNSSAKDAGLIRVRAGDRMPGVPRQSLKLSLDYAITAAFSLGAEFLAQSAQYAAGDENNRDALGMVPGFAVVNLNAGYNPAPGWSLFLNVDNLFDRRYTSFGQLGENVFSGPGKTFDAAHPSATQFRAVAAPRAVSIGFRYGFAG